VNVHATCIAIDGAAVLLRGASGSGKSDLALRLIDEGAVLVADDRTDLARDGDTIMASPPAAIAGRIEVRGIGIIASPSLARAPVSLLVDLIPPDAVVRLPEPRQEELLGVALPVIALAPFEASAPAKLRAALRALVPGPSRD
jgi:serine kinase of HPr protein (carbohydrate metabolism regulator)